MYYSKKKDLMLTVTQTHTQRNVIFFFFLYKFLFISRANDTFWIQQSSCQHIRIEFPLFSSLLNIKQSYASFWLRFFNKFWTVSFLVFIRPRFLSKFSVILVLCVCDKKIVGEFLQEKQYHRPLLPFNVHDWPIYCLKWKADDNFP